jgi:hypothetical protein
MAVPLLDNEFMQYWLKLTVVEKESLLNVARNYVDSKQGGNDVNDLRKKIIQEEREKYFQGEGKSFTWEDVKQMAVNKEKRNAI